MSELRSVAGLLSLRQPFDTKELEDDQAFAASARKVMLSVDGTKTENRLLPAASPREAFFLFHTLHPRLEDLAQSRGDAEKKGKYH